MKILILINHYPISPRLEKMIRAINKLDCNHEIVVHAWNRLNVDTIEKHEFNIITHDSEEGYGNKLKKLIGMRKFFLRTRDIIDDIKPDILYAIEWDMLALVSILKKKYRIIYEIYDIPESNIKAFYFIQRFIEKISLRKVDTIIFSSRYFGEKYDNINIPKYTISNKPSRDIVGNRKSDKYLELNATSKYKITIGYIGTVRYLDIITNLVDSLKSIEDARLIFFGTGPELDNIIKYCKKNNIKNVEFTGRYDYRDIKNIYECCDIVWAAYPCKNTNVKLAISNKYYESIVFGVPAIYSNNTRIGDFVDENKLGFIVNPYLVEDIINLIENIKNNKEYLAHIKKNMIDISEEMFYESEEYIVNNVFSE